MKLASEQRISAPREQVFAALNDPDILRQCIPGCESLNKASDTEMTATVALKIGPVKATFKGHVELSNLVPPESYSISGEGTGGPAGFAKGGADVKLLEDGSGTLLQYQVNADVGGRIAQVGGRLIESTARNLSGKFFDRFSELVETAGGTARPAATAEIPAQSPASSRWIWMAGSVAVLVALAAMIASMN